jgi:hypothetical protein
MIRAIGEDLFCRGDLSDYLDRQKIRAVSEVNTLDQTHLLATDESSLVDSIFLKHMPEPINLADTQGHYAWQTQTEAEIEDYGRRLVVDATRVTIEIPFTGSGVLLKLQPSTFSSVVPVGVVEGSTLYKKYDLAGDDETALVKTHEEQVKLLNTYIQAANRDLEQFSAVLRSAIAERLRLRRKAAFAGIRAIKALGIPMTRQSDTERMIELPRVRKEFPLKAADKVEMEPWWVVPDSEFVHILNVIDRLGVTIEKMPHTFAAMQEEHIRNIILVILNSHYENPATGETFRNRGKADIVLEFKGRSAFVAECKFWEGEKSLLDALEQLFGYTAWRDAKIALIIFSRGKDTTKVLTATQRVLSQHATFRRSLPSRSESSFRYILTHPRDTDREVELAVLIFAVASEV